MKKKTKEKQKSGRITEKKTKESTISFWIIKNELGNLMKR
jgi:hypothetical protein